MSGLCSLGADIGAISTKGVILDRDGQLLAESYLWTAGDPMGALRRLLAKLFDQLPPDARITAIGTTGSARRLAGAMLGADAVKNEITAHAVGTVSRHPSVRTILEIGGQDAKIILLKDQVVSDYAMNSLCAAGTGAFLSAQAKRLGMEIGELGPTALMAAAPARLSARCTVFAESDLIHKAQVGYSKADLVAGLCASVVRNYLNNVGKGKKIAAPVVFQGGVSRNEGVVAAFEKELGCNITVDEKGHLMGAVGAALLARSVAQRAEAFDFDKVNADFETRVALCEKCPNHCEVVQFYRDDKLLDYWGNRCDAVAVL